MSSKKPMNSPIKWKKSGAQVIALEKSLRLERERARSSIIRAPEDGVIVDMVPLAKGP